jgi:pilus assembly protein CpaD
MTIRTALCAASVLAAILVGSCSSDDKVALTEDGATNHPITVEPAFRSLDFSYQGAFSPDDKAKLAAFVDDYMTRGSGAISITAPAGPDASRTITGVGEQLVALGVPRERILVGTGDAGSPDRGVELDYISYSAHTDACGDWSQNAGDTADNLPMPNFGCSVQHNIAAEVVDPRDLIDTRALGPADATRRMIMLNKYEQAEATATTKTKDQSGAVSDIGQ